MKNEQSTSDASYRGLENYDCDCKCSDTESIISDTVDDTFVFELGTEGIDENMLRDRLIWTPEGAVDSSQLSDPNACFGKNLALCHGVKEEDKEKCHGVKEEDKENHPLPYTTLEQAAESSENGIQILNILSNSKKETSLKCSEELSSAGINISSDKCNNGGLKKRVLRKSPLMPMRGVSLASDGKRGNRTGNKRQRRKRVAKTLAKAKLASLLRGRQNISAKK